MPTKLKNAQITEVISGLDYCSFVVHRS